MKCKSDYFLNNYDLLPFNYQMLVNIFVVYCNTFLYFAVYLPGIILPMANKDEL